MKCEVEVEDFGGAGMLLLDVRRIVQLVTTSFYFTEPFSKT